MTETRACQNCKQNFTIEPEDFDFYERVKVPAPTFCSDCRLQRRMAWRNERSFHKGKCAVTGKDFLTMFSPEAKITVYDRDYWWSDKWDQLESGRDYDFNRPFFVQFAELMRKAPLPNLANSNCINSEYGNHSLDCKNCYLFYASIGAEDSAYVTGAMKTKNSFDIYKQATGTDCYENVLCAEVNRVLFSFGARECIQSDFLHSCTNVQQSLGCINVKNRSHCIWNVPYSKEEYQKQRGQYDFGSYAQLEQFKKKFSEFILKYPRRYGGGVKSVDVTGYAILNSNNSYNCFDIYGELEDCKYIYHAATMNDSYDGYGMGATAELMYEAVDTGAQAMHCMFNVFTHACQEAFYTYACHSSSNLFGCVGLRTKQHCILNKQYTKEEYEKLVPRIIAQMNEMPYVDTKLRIYKYGEFFPIELSPFAYNETIAQEYAPLTRVQVKDFGYHWRELEVRHHAITIKAVDLPDHIKNIPDSILKEVIECAHKGTCNQQCTAAFKIIPAEFQFLKHFNIALPRLCPNCRHYERLAQRPPFKLWHRTCQCRGLASEAGVYKNLGKHQHGDTACTVEFETAYDPAKSEIVYCESCYQSEVV